MIKKIAFDRIVVSSKEAMVSDMAAVAFLLAAKEGGYGRFGEGVVFRREPTDDDIHGAKDVIVVSEDSVLCTADGERKRVSNPPHMVVADLLGMHRELSSVCPWWHAYGDDETPHGVVLDGPADPALMYANPLAECLYGDWNEFYGSEKPVGYPVEGWLHDLGKSILEKAERYSEFDRKCHTRPVEYDWMGVPLQDYSWVGKADLDLVECRARGVKRVLVTPFGDGAKFEKREAILFRPENAGHTEKWFRESNRDFLVTNCPATPDIVKKVVENCLDRVPL